MHEQFLLAALEQAKHGQGICAPNPCVGAVAVQDGKIIAQAWHKGAGTPHAEQLVLAKLPAHTSNLSLYITLEPCNHWGRTPPCVDQIIQHGGIQEVVFAYLDPNPIVAQNQSSERLRKQGIRVTHFPMPVIDDFYKSYTHWMVKKRPRVTVKMAQTLDGKIAGPRGARIQLSNSLCEQFTHQQRAKTDVILTSARTIVADNPHMNARLATETKSKPVAILDSHCSLGTDFRIFSTASPCFIYHVQSSFQVKGSHSLYPMPVKNGKMDLSAVMDHLGSLGYHDVWVEAGSEIFTALHQQGLVQKTYLYLVPKILGQNALTAYLHPDLFDRAHSLSWHEMGDNMIACLDWQED